MENFSNFPKFLRGGGGGAASSRRRYTLRNDSDQAEIARFTYGWEDAKGRGQGRIQDMKL